MVQFSNYTLSSGGYHSFATRGLGSRNGFMASWNFLHYYFPGPGLEFHPQ